MTFNTILASVVLSASVTACSGSNTNLSDLQGQIVKLKNQASMAQDAVEIQNLMSRRAMYHSLGHNEKELELWSAKQEIRWAQNQGCWIGRELLTKYYVTTNYQMQKAQLKAMSESNPKIENDYEKNRYIGNSVYHLLTTPIIEVAGDRATAKAFWYTPGAILSSQDGLTASGMHMWETYHVDLVREGGQWRFWHLQVSTDWASPFGEPLAVQEPDVAMMGSEGDAQGNTSGGPGPGAEEINVPGPSIEKVLYKEYSPTRVTADYLPRLPEPYTTFSETFEYADCSN